MTEQRIDHAAEARKLLDAVKPFRDQDLDVAMRSAQVHATLALVEETAALRRAQEAANDRERAMSLIFMVGSRDRAVRDAARDGVFWENDEQGEALRPEIARALGLSNDNEETNE